MRWGVAAAVVLSACALVSAAPAGASRGAAYGIQDDAWLLDGPGALSDRAATLRGLGVRLVRFTLRWDKIAPTQPANARHPPESPVAGGPVPAGLPGPPLD